WTRNSNHTTGRAVDVMIDGTYNNALGYQRLAQIAAEEGLHTLGAKDPGHVELPRGVDGGGPAPQAPRSTLAGNSTPGVVAGASPYESVGFQGIAQVARVAEVAAVARVAQVA